MKYIITLSTLILSFIANAQEKANVKDSVIAPVKKHVEMADQMRAEGGIYVVMAVVATVLTGIFLYMIYVDRRLAKIEKELNQK